MINRILDATPIMNVNKKKPQFEQLPPSESKLLPSIEKPPALELKQLPSNLKYAFLGPSESPLVIIASDLTSMQEKKLMEVLTKHKTSLGWTIADIKGISPNMCMHRIHLKENSKPVCQPQRRLNQHMKEVVREVLKLLDVGVIYPIFDSTWISPVQIVPKRSGITVVKNDKEELVPPRMTTS